MEIVYQNPWFELPPTPTKKMRFTEWFMRNFYLIVGSKLENKPKKKEKGGGFHIGKKGWLSMHHAPPWWLFKGVKISRLDLLAFAIALRENPKSEIIFSPLAQACIYFSSGWTLHSSSARPQLRKTCSAVVSFKVGMLWIWWGLLWNLSYRVQISESEKLEFSKGKAVYRARRILSP